MKKQLKKTYSLFIIAAIVIAGATSCKKDLSGAGTQTNTTGTVTTSTSSTIAVAVNGGTTTSGGTATDSVLVIHNCERGQHRDSVAASALPTTIQTYLTTNYAGYTFNKAFAVKDTTGTITGYVVIINFNNKPVALQFAADGTFVKVLEQREKGDMNGNGWHPGGRFCGRDGQYRDSVSLSALPSAITTYFTTNYATDTLLKAFRMVDSSFLVISTNNGVFATLFTNAGVFVSRIALPAPAPDGILAAVAQTDLPSNTQSYLGTTYPNYVFDRAESVTVNGVLKGYVVIIDANNTKYAVVFDASGNFLKARVIW